ncbi:hypothetical protein STRCI_002694 [Streptomyces cinnabarinus]|uniref:Serine/threonine protein kinase n=1 Tax=Streptomyces cinnabarinus TaxID=67287 RepID=A0ABY7KEZ8_9ACTN|nr:hypothetical protein [Streptomyces cinnabarinus]WAZ21516.1 hypothetical protein STRCI_002694 [Streptomyces cinnabarinus]
MSSYGDPNHRTAPPPPPNPPTPPGSGGQPAWAWWVIGIVIPAIGIAVTLFSVNDRDSDDSSTDSPAATTGAQGGDNSAQASGTPADSGGEEEAAPAKPVFGPADFSARAAYGDAGFLELDTVPPQEFGQDTDGTDLLLDATATEPVDAEGTVGPLPAGTGEATEAECRETIQKNSVTEVDLTPGTRFCLQTGEGRTASLRVLSAPVEGEGTVRFKLTVWDLPQ